MANSTRVYASERTKSETKIIFTKSLPLLVIKKEVKNEKKYCEMGFCKKDFCEAVKISPEPKPQGSGVALVQQKPVVLEAKVVKVKKVKIKKVKNKFPYGWCTWYVASKRNVTWSGNAKAWDDNAKRQGYTVSRNPIAGAIMVTNESRWGHVAYVEWVSATKIMVSEMNYVGFARVSTRIIPKNYGVYIY